MAYNIYNGYVLESVVPRDVGMYIRGFLDCPYEEVRTDTLKLRQHVMDIALETWVTAERILDSERTDHWEHIWDQDRLGETQECAHFLFQKCVEGFTLEGLLVQAAGRRHSLANTLFPLRYSWFRHELMEELTKIFETLRMVGWMRQDGLLLKPRECYKSLYTTISRDLLAKWE